MGRVSALMLEPFLKPFSQKWSHAGLLVGFCLLLYMVNLGQWDLWNPDEPRYGQVAREMVQRGDWVLMHFNGKVYPDKPPLFFWLIAFSSFLWQGFSSFAVRFPSAFFGTLTVLLTFFLGRELYSPRTGLVSGFVLATSAEFAYLSTRGNIDPTLTFFTTAAVACFLQWHRKKEARRRGWWLRGVYAAMALATLTKGPVGFILPVLVCLAFLTLQRDWTAVKETRPLQGAVLFAAIVLAWYLPALVEGGKDYFVATVLRQTIERYGRGWSHPRPVYYYLYTFPVVFLPWIFFLPAAVVHGYGAEMLEKRREFHFLLLWCIVVFLFFSFSKGKRGVYLLPLFPAAALLVGKLWDDCASGKIRGMTAKWVTVSIYGLSALTLGLGFGILWVVGERFPSYLSFSLPAAFFLSGAGVGLFLLHRLRRRAGVFGLLVGLMAAGFFYTQRVVFPLVNPVKSARFISQEIASLVQPGDRLCTYGIGTGPYNFYTGIVPIEEVDLEKDLVQLLSSKERVFCLLNAGDFASLREKGKMPPVPVVLERQVSDNRLVLFSNR